MLPSSGLLKKGFGICHKYAADYIYVIGGDDLDTFEFVNTCMKFHVK